MATAFGLSVGGGLSGGGSGGGTAANITVGTTTITGGTTGRILYDNAGVLGEYPVGTGVATALGIAVNTTGGIATYPVSGAGITLTANSTLTSGFAAGNVLMSDGTTLQVGTNLNATSLVLNGGQALSGTIKLSIEGQALASGATGTSSGWYAQMDGDTTPRVRVGLNSSDAASITLGPGNGPRDVIMERLGGATFRFGTTDVATPIDQTFTVQSVIAGTTDTAGATTTWRGSASTGTGLPGRLNFQVSPSAAGTGSTQNAFTTVLSLGGVSTNTAALFRANEFSIGAGTLAMWSSELIGWGSSVVTMGQTTLDTDLYRSGAGVIGVGTTGTSPNGSLTMLNATLAGTLNLSLAGALSSQTVLISGAPVTGGTATTTFPLIYFNTTGATAPTTFSTNGTFLGINAPSGFTGNFLDFHVNGASTVMRVTAGGNVISSGTASSFTGAAVTGALTTASAVATPAGGSTAARLLFGTTAGFGIYYGSGAPSVSAAQGSLYMRSDGSSGITRAYINSDGSTGWVSIATAT